MWQRFITPSKNTKGLRAEEGIRNIPSPKIPKATAPLPPTDTKAADLLFAALLHDPPKPLEPHVLEHLQSLHKRGLLTPMLRARLFALPPDQIKDLAIALLLGRWIALIPPKT